MFQVRNRGGERLRDGQRDGVQDRDDRRMPHRRQVHLYNHQRTGLHGHQRQGKALGAAGMVEVQWSVR